MTHQTYNNKRVIWESQTKQIGVIAVSFLFVAAAVWTRDKYSSFMFWGTIVLFGGGGLLMLGQLLNPKNLFVTHDSPLGKEILAYQFEKAKEDLGFFSYTRDGFTVQEHSGVKTYKWSHIETIFGFKEDHYTIDDICIDIFMTDNFKVRLTENMPGWYQFNKRLSENFPTIQTNWETNIAFPAFDTKLTLLFDRKGKTLQEAEAACYAE